MASFNNTQEVKNQAAYQYVYGNMNFFSVTKDEHLDPNGVDSKESLDNEILASLAFTHMHDRKSSVESPHQQTCEWIFKLPEYDSWRIKTSGLLWIKGKPGAGKSTLMSHLYRTVCCQPTSKQDILLSFFFSARGVPLQRTYLGMLRSLLNQLFNQDHSVRDVLRKPYTEKQKSLGKNALGQSHLAWEWQSPELADLLFEMILTSAGQRQITILIDALDEAGQQDAQRIAHYFHTINDRVAETGAMVKLCISCRHYPIVSIIEATEVYVESHNRDDIRSYIRDHIRIGALHSDYTSNEWRDLTDQLERMSDGVFQWAHLVVPMVKRCIGDGESPKQIRQWLTDVPQELTDVYKHILQNVIERKYRLQCLRLFKWVCLATRSLSVTELRYAVATCDITTRPVCPEDGDLLNLVATDKIMISRIKSWSGGLIEVVHDREKDTTKVQVIHQSVNDFFMSQGFPFLIELNEEAEEGGKRSTSCAVVPNITQLLRAYHGHLYWSCLGYMFMNKNLFVNRFDVDIEIIPLNEYVIRNTLVHAKKAEEHRGDDLAFELQLLQFVIPKWTSDSQAYACKDFPAAPWGSSSHIEPTVLHIAAFSGLEDLVHYILRQGVHIDTLASHGWTALHHASHNGHLAVAKTLVQAGANIRKLTYDFESPLMLAARQSHAELFRWILNQTDELNDNAGTPRNVLYKMVETGNLNMARMCIEAGADINRRTSSSSNTLLHVAISRGHEHLTKLLLAKGADVNAQSGLCGTVLQTLCASTSPHMLRILLDAGADVDAQSGCYGTALQAASRFGRQDTVRILLAAGADANIQVGQYGTALEAASYNGTLGIIKMLLAAGADVNAQAGRYGTALVAASYRGHIDVVRVLLAAGADANASSDNYGTALEASLGNDREEIKKVLRQFGAVG